MVKSDEQPGADGEAWEDVLASLCRLQTVLPDAVLVGGTASALYARHRLSFDHDHVLPDLRERFDAVLDELYPQKNGDSWAVRTQLVMQLAAPPPHDLDTVDLAEYKGVRPPFDRWSHVADICGTLSDTLLASCVEALRADASLDARRVETRINAWREAHAAGQTTPHARLPGLRA